MVTRTARKGPNRRNSFWGCASYPDCKSPRSLAGDQYPAGIEDESEHAALTGSVEWRDRRAQLNWAAEYVPIRADSPLFSNELEASPALARLRPQTLELQSRHRKTSQLEDRRQPARPLRCTPAARHTPASTSGAETWRSAKTRAGSCSSAGVCPCFGMTQRGRSGLNVSMEFSSIGSMKKTPQGSNSRRRWDCIRPRKRRPIS